MSQDNKSVSARVNLVSLTLTLVVVAIMVQVYRRINQQNPSKIELYFTDSEGYGLKSFALMEGENLSLSLVIRNLDDSRLNCSLTVYLTNITYTYNVLTLSKISLNPGEEMVIPLAFKPRLARDVKLVAELSELEKQEIHSIWISFKVRP